MPEYIIARMDAPLPALAGRVFDPDAEPFCARPFAAIDRYAWPGDYRPEARAYVGWDEDGLAVLLCADEPAVAAAAKTFGGPVWRDSCLECFLMPFADDPRYINIETNAAGTALIALGAGRGDRVPLTECPPGMEIQASRHAGGWWAVRYRVPFALIASLYGRAPEVPGTLRGNFYCCDETLRPHFGSWSPIEAPRPDFHRPECFGTLVMAG